MRALVLFLFVALLAGCIFLVSPEEYGSTCRFQGEDTQCGACIATKCRTEVDTCCRDPNCAQPLRDLDDCATRSSFACNTLKGTAFPAVAGSLAQCIQRECGAVCVELTGTSTTSCREPRLGEGSACTCKSSGEANDFLCNARAFPNTICCAPKGWPAPGLECTCRPLNCTPTTEGCFCRFVDFTPKERECSAVHCCVERDACTCQAKECSPMFQREVPSCNVTELLCPDEQEERESCSERAP